MNRGQIVLVLMAVVVMLGWAHGHSTQHQPAGELVYAMHVTIAPAWFDPAENGGLITPFALHYALHDGVVRPMPGAKIGNSLAESWTESAAFYTACREKKLRGLTGVGHRVAEHTINSIPLHPGLAFENIRLQGQ
jgi:hypothetical protein